MTNREGPGVVQAKPGVVGATHSYWGYQPQWVEVLNRRKCERSELERGGSVGLEERARTYREPSSRRWRWSARASLVRGGAEPQ